MQKDILILIILALILLILLCASTVEGEIMGGLRADKNESEIIGRVAEKYRLDLYDTTLLFAIRKAEAGPEGFEFGVKAAKGTNLEEQARWAAGTIRANRRRWKEAGRPGDFISFLGNRYAPTKEVPWEEASLNEKWVPNVKFWMRQYWGNRESERR